MKAEKKVASLCFEHQDLTVKANSDDAICGNKL